MEKKNISISYIDDGKTFDWGKNDVLMKAHNR